MVCRLEAAVHYRAPPSIAKLMPSDSHGFIRIVGRATALIDSERFGCRHPALIMDSLLHVDFAVRGRRATEHPGLEIPKTRLRSCA